MKIILKSRPKLLNCKCVITPFYFFLFKDAKNTVAHGDATYYFSDIKATWKSASSHCHQLGGHLTSIHTKSENDFVTNELAKRFGLISQKLNWDFQDYFIFAAQRFCGLIRKLLLQHFNFYYWIIYPFWGNLMSRITAKSKSYLDTQSSIVKKAFAYLNLTGLKNIKSDLFLRTKCDPDRSKQDSIKVKPTTSTSFGSFLIIQDPGS